MHCPATLHLQAPAYLPHYLPHYLLQVTEILNAAQELAQEHNHQQVSLAG
jgi:hypothetical protein